MLNARLAVMVILTFLDVNCVLLERCQIHVFLHGAKNVFKALTAVQQDPARALYVHLALILQIGLILRVYSVRLGVLLILQVI